MAQATSFDGSPRGEITLTGVTSILGGGIASIANPFGVPVLIKRATLYIKTASTGAANLSAGIAADGVTSATDIINALAVNGAIAGKVYNGFVMQNGAKTEVTAPAVWTTSKYLTVSGDAATTGLVARLILEVIPLEDAA